jgi:hypothetical protein
MMPSRGYNPGSIDGGFTNSGRRAVGCGLVCRVVPRSEHFGNCPNRDGPQVAYVISDSGFQSRQYGVQFALSLGSDSEIRQHPYTVLKAGRHESVYMMTDYVAERDTVIPVCWYRGFPLAGRWCPFFSTNVL